MMARRTRGRGAVAKKKHKDDTIAVERYGDGLIARNKRARHEYDLGDRFEAGLVLGGSEVKSLRLGAADLVDSYVVVDGSEAFVVGLNIPELLGMRWNHEPKRRRKLLLHRDEIEQIKRAVEREGMTAVATRIYFRRGRAKLEIALARGRRMHDKREAIKRRDAEREADAAIRAASRHER
jgi:SsrA-binding protein